MALQTMPSNNVPAACPILFSPSLPHKLKLMTLARTQTATGNGLRAEERRSNERFPHKTPKTFSLEYHIGKMANSFLPLFPLIAYSLEY